MAFLHKTRLQFFPIQILAFLESIDFNFQKDWVGNTDRSTHTVYHPSPHPLIKLFKLIRSRTHYWRQVRGSSLANTQLSSFRRVKKLDGIIFWMFFFFIIISDERLNRWAPNSVLESAAIADVTTSVPNYQNYHNRQTEERILPSKILHR